MAKSYLSNIVMKNKMIKIKSEKLFPFHFQLLGLVSFFIGCILILLHPFIAPLPIVIGLIFFTSYSGVEFNLRDQSYREYNWFLFFKSGKFLPYNKVEKIFINASEVSQYIYTMVTTGKSYYNIEYDAYLKFSNGQKIFLASNRNKNKLLKRLKKLTDHLESDIVDNS